MKYRVLGSLGFALVVATVADGAPAVAQPFAYITNFGSNTVSVVDTATDTLAATLPVGPEPWGVAVSPGGSRVCGQQ